VTVDKQLISSIGRGVLVFAAIGPNDTEKDVDSMASRVLKMKMWPDESGSGVRQARARIETGLKFLQQWKRNVQDIDGEILCGELNSVSPSFTMMTIWQYPNSRSWQIRARATNLIFMVRLSQRRPNSSMTISCRKCKVFTRQKRSRMVYSRP